jgi:SAM-dependent methyltransferase
MSRKQRKKQQHKKASGAAKQARGADKYKLYEESVQHPDSDVHFVQRVFKNRFGRPARLLREDFCGTSALACEWISSHRENQAWGIDIDPEPLDWGREHNVAKLSPEQQSRLELIEGDVLTSKHAPVDVTVGFNFSYFLFKTRPGLLRYFEAAYATLKDEGLLVLDAYGGPDAQQTMTENTEHDGFEYVWDQDYFDPIHHEARNYIHFEFPDGSRMHRAFRYDWRLWTLPEIRELLEEAGFVKTEVYWEGADPETNEGNGIYRKAESAPDDPAWVSYIVGIR